MPMPPGGVTDLELRHAAGKLDVKAATALPAGPTPQVPSNDKKFFSLGPIDEVCWFFPELNFVTRRDRESAARVFEL